MTVKRRGRKPKKAGRRPNEWMTLEGEELRQHLMNDMKWTDIVGGKQSPCKTYLKGQTLGGKKCAELRAKQDKRELVDLIVRKHKVQGESKSGEEVVQTDVEEPKKKEKVKPKVKTRPTPNLYASGDDTDTLNTEELEKSIRKNIIKFGEDFEFDDDDGEDKDEDEEREFQFSFQNEPSVSSMFEII